MTDILKKWSVSSLCGCDSDIPALSDLSRCSLLLSLLNHSSTHPCFPWVNVNFLTAKRLPYLCNSPGEDVTEPEQCCLPLILTGERSGLSKRIHWNTASPDHHHCAQRAAVFTATKAPSCLCWRMNFNQILQHCSAVEVCPQRFGSC